ncbi:MAG: 5'-deoxyadenosine deaminase [Bilophila sp.]
MARLLIANGTVITMNPTRDVVVTDLLIENDRITRMAPGLAACVAVDNVLDATDSYIIPGLIQSHMHTTQALFRGLADELELMDWLQRRIWPLEGAHTHESNAVAARLAAAEGLRSGVTAFIDMGTAHHQDAIFETMRDVGMRGLFGKCMLDFGGTDVPATLMEDTATCLRESERLMNRWHMSAGGRLRYAFAPRFVPSCTEKLLLATRDMARANGVRLHTHASENTSECSYVESLVHTRNLLYLHKIGYTGEDVILAHCIWLDAEEIKILADTGTHAVHCPSSNVKLASGIAHVNDMLDAGCNVALGLDGAHNHMDALLEMRLAAGLQKVRTHAPTVLPPLQVLEMATLGGARALGQVADLGSLEPGKKADLVILNPCKLNMTPRIQRDPIAHIVYQATQENVVATLVDGRILYQNGHYTTLDLDETLKEAERLCEELLQRDSIRRLFA